MLTLRKHDCWPYKVGPADLEELYQERDGRVNTNHEDEEMNLIIFASKLAKIENCGRPVRNEDIERKLTKAAEIRNDGKKMEEFKRNLLK